MGVIKDGTISGILPEKKGFAVHYPGYPSSISRAVETLGGFEGILKAHSSQSNSLELRFRPEDPYSHPAFGKLRPCCSFLLKISKKKTVDHANVVSEHVTKSSEVNMVDLDPTCYSPSSGQQRNGPESVVPAVNKDNQDQIREAAVAENLFADIVARVPEAYNFNGMVDYQHIPDIHADVLEKGDLMDVDQEELMLLVPQLFSPKDMPEKLVLKPPSALSSKKKQEAVVKQRWEMNIEPCLAIDYGIEDFTLLGLREQRTDNSQIPKKVNWEEHIERGSAQYEGLKAVSKLFDERPIWPRQSLIERLLDENLKFSDHMFKRHLFRTAYYFSTGPFLRFWIRKGYDPRKDPDSRIYQGIYFRIPHPLRPYGDPNPKDELHTWKNLSAFRVFPWKFHSSLQLFELVDDYIQQEIQKPAHLPVCSSSTGWFSSYVLNSLRLRMAVRFLSVCPSVDAKDLYRSACERFERSKKTHALKKDKRRDEEQHVDRGLSCQASENIVSINSSEREFAIYDGNDEADGGGTEYDNEAEEEEEEEEEEELDDYESLHMNGDDGDDFSLEPSYPTGENISKNYLQELFGSFPTAEVGNDKVLFPDSSDGEFQIFEDDSGDNGNFFDDDDC